MVRGRKRKKRNYTLRLLHFHHARAPFRMSHTTLTQPVDMINSGVCVYLCDSWSSSAVVSVVVPVARAEGSCVDTGLADNWSITSSPFSSATCHDRGGVCVCVCVCVCGVCVCVCMCVRPLHFTHKPHPYERQCPHLLHEPRHLVLRGVEGRGCTHGRVHDLRMHIEVLKQVLKLRHGPRYLQHTQCEQPLQQTSHVLWQLPALSPN